MFDEKLNVTRSISWTDMTTEEIAVFAKVLLLNPKGYRHSEFELLEEHLNIRHILG